MAKRVIHVTEEEAATDFGSLLARVRAGTEVVIEENSHPIALLYPAEPVRRTVSDCIASAKAHEAELARVPVLDPDFAADVEAIRKNRRPWNPPAWD